MLAYLLAACVGIASLAIALTYAMKRLRETGEMLEKAATRLQAQSDRARRAARACLELRHEIRAAGRRKTNMEAACAEVEERLKAVGADRNRLLVLDDRRTQADSGWIVHIANPDYASRVNNNLDPVALDAWAKGRRYVVWALEEGKAREKVLARHPEKRGFYIQKIEKYVR